MADIIVNNQMANFNTGPYGTPPLLVASKNDNTQSRFMFYKYRLNDTDNEGGICRIESFGGRKKVSAEKELSRRIKNNTICNAGLQDDGRKNG